MTRTKIHEAEEIPSMAPLNPQQRKFVFALVWNGGNQRKAALEAGYGGANPQSADVTASRLCANPQVQAAIRDLCRIVLGTDGLATGVEALRQIAADPFHKDRARAAAKLVDFTFPQTTRVEIEHTDKRDEEMIELCKKFSLEYGVPIANMLGPNRCGGPEWSAFDSAWNARWGGEDPEAQFDRLCLLVAEFGPSYANMVFGPFMTDTQKAKLDTVLADPRHMLKRLPPLIEAQPVDPNNPHGF